MDRVRQLHPEPLPLPTDDKEHATVNQLEFHLLFLVKLFAFLNTIICLFQLASDVHGVIYI